MPAGAVMEPEELAEHFARFPELAKRAPEAAQKVKEALSAKAAAHKAAAPVVRPAAAGGSTSALSSRPQRSTLDRIASTSAAMDRIAPGRPPSRSNILPRLGLAFLAAVFVLELVSYMTGNYFKYNLGQLGANAKAGTKYVGLYGDQLANLQKAQQQAQGAPAGKSPTALSTASGGVLS